MTIHKAEVFTSMEESTTKEKILKEIRNALISKLDNPFKDVDFSSSVYTKMKDVPEVTFVMNLKNAGGNFVYCENEKAIADNLKLLFNQKKWDSIYAVDPKIIGFLKHSDINVISDPGKFKDQKVGATRCDYLIARFGSVMVSSALSSGRRMFVFPEVHIVIATLSQVVSELKDALKGMKTKYAGNFPSQLTLITGPSRTADIEKTLVMGAHGPKELYVLMVDDL